MKKNLKNLTLGISFLLSLLVFTVNISAVDENSEVTTEQNTVITNEQTQEENSLPLALAGIGGAIIQVKRYSKSIKGKPTLKGGEFLIEKENKTLAIGFPQPDGSIIERLIAFVDQLDSINLKKPARLATTQNISLSGFAILDGIQAADKDEILVWNQSNQVENGVYIVNGGLWTRRLDSKGSFESADAAIVYIKEGTQWADTEFNQITDNPVVGASALVWTPRASQNVDGGDVDSLP